MRWLRRRRAREELGEPDPRALAEQLWCGWQQALPEARVVAQVDEPAGTIGLLELRDLVHKLATLHP